MTFFSFYIVIFSFSLLFSEKNADYVLTAERIEWTILLPSASSVTVVERQQPASTIPPVDWNAAAAA